MLSRLFPRPVTLRQLLLAQAGVSFFLLSGALIGQFGFELFPCELCLYQRYPHLAVILIAALAAWRGPPKLQYYAVFLCVALLLGDAGLAFYHTGVEQEWFKGPEGCSSASTGAETLEELRRQIMEAPLVSCSQAMGYVFGLSLAAWNAMLSAAAAVVTLAMLRKKPL